MRRLLPIVLMLALAACGSPPPAPKPYGADLPPLTANGLPGTYELCARNAAAKTAAMYDVYYPCRAKIAQYLSLMGGKTQQEKAAMAEEMEKRAMNYAQQQTEAFHGTDAVRRASAPAEKPTAPPPAASAAPLSPDDPAKKWGACAVQTILGAYQGGMDDAAIVALARARCNHLWSDAESDVLDQLYGKILASVKKSSDPGYTIGPPAPSPAGEIRM